MQGYRTAPPTQFMQSRANPSNYKQYLIDWELYNITRVLV
jgi:hypothetical protein